MWLLRLGQQHATTAAEQQQKVSTPPNINTLPATINTIHTVANPLRMSFVDTHLKRRLPANLSMLEMQAAVLVSGVHCANF